MSSRVYGEYSIHSRQQRYAPTVADQSLRVMSARSYYDVTKTKTTHKKNFFFLHVIWPAFNLNPKATGNCDLATRFALHSFPEGFFGKRGMVF